MIFTCQGPDGGGPRPSSHGEGFGFDRRTGPGEEPRCLAQDHNDEEQTATGQQPHGGDDPGLPQAPAGGDGVVKHDIFYGLPTGTKNKKCWDPSGLGDFVGSSSRTQN